MSTGSITGSLPPVNPALEPASVRNGTPATKQAYQQALGFEQVLVNQLAQEMVSSVAGDGSTSADGTGDPSGSSDAAAGQYSQLLPGALTSGIMSAGGLGVASQLLPALDPSLKATS